MNRIGMHRVYFTKENPLIDTVNVLGVKHICAYANGEIEDTTIAKKGVKGVYAEQWRYNPNHPIFDEPLDVIRLKIGQCTDYGNLLTNLYRSIGLPANSVLIYNGAVLRDTINGFFWRYSREPGWPFVSMLTNTLTSCDDTTKEWEFNYHVVCRLSNYFCDAFLGLFRTDTDYDAWWRYYLYPRSFYPPYYQNEPPDIPPVYYDWNFYVPHGPYGVYPRPWKACPIFNFHHP
jgi:hypothetical protein